MLVTQNIDNLHEKAGSKKSISYAWIFGKSLLHEL